MMKSAMTDFRIAAALVKAIQSPYEDGRFTEQFIDMTERKRNRPNLLADFVKRQRPTELLSSD